MMGGLMQIEDIVKEALEHGYLTSARAASIRQICDSPEELSVEEYITLDRLMEALLAGQIVLVPHKQLTNVMEELVLMEVICQVADLEVGEEYRVDAGDIAAYALNRLPPLYATTEEGANYQRQHAEDIELNDLIAQQVEEALARYLDRPQFYPKRQALGEYRSGKLLKQVSSLLQIYASSIETPARS